MVSEKDLQDLYAKAEYGRIKALVKEEDLSAFTPEGASKLLILAWSHHQLGEYEHAAQIFVGINMAQGPETEAGESARRGLAHAILQDKGDIDRANEIFKEIPQSLSRENLRMNMFLTAARKGIRIPVDEILDTMTFAKKHVPEVVIGHIINNATFTLYEAREQAQVKPSIPFLPAFMETALLVYRKKGAAKNHIAGVLYRLSLVLEAAGKMAEAKSAAQESRDIWQELVNSQGGERYQQNLQGAIKQLEKLGQK